MGRWTEATIEGRDGRKVLVINAYRVVQDKNFASGPKTAFAQQWRSMRHMGIQNPDPRQRILADLYERIQDATRNSMEVVVMLDANDSLDINTPFAKWVRSLQLVDSLSMLHGQDDIPSTYSRGRRRLDYILTTPILAQYVVASGILPLEEMCSSDHRAVFTDIDLDGYLKGAPSPLAMLSRRGLVSADPRAVTRYRKLLRRFLDTSNVVQRVSELVEAISPGTDATPEQRNRMDELEQTFTAGRLQCEVECRKITSHPWSPTLDLARRKIRYWRTWIKEKRNNRDLTVIREKIWPEAPAQDNNITWKQITSGLSNATKELKAIILRAPELRLQHLQERAELAAGIGSEKVAQEIRLLQRVEIQRQSARRIQRLLGRGNGGAMSHILVTQPDGSVVKIIDQQEINKRLLDRNRQHFSQADGTPFTVAPLKDYFGKYGTSGACKTLFDGALDTNELDIDDATALLLTQLRSISDGTIDTTITAIDLQDGYYSWKETTSTSPSGIHLGHEKALLQPKRHQRQVEEEEAKEDPDQTLCSEVFSLKARFLNFAVQHGHVYSRWKVIVNAMIEKIPGRPLVEKLRVIHLIESDFNLLIGILWGRRLMAQAERLNALGTEQWGSRKDKSAVQALMDKHLTYSISRLARMNLSTMDNDAKSCYDRIVMLVASLCSQQLGMDPKACELFLKVLESAQYHVKTQMGVSEESYCTTPEATIHGPGQGGRGSPCVWIIISCLLMKCLRHKSQGMTLNDPLLKRLLKQFSTGFVDDVTLWLGNMLRSLQQGETIEQIIAETTEAAQWWERLLYATGGKLELQKCFVYIIYWVFDREGRPRLLEPTEFPETINIIDSSTGTPVTIDILNSYESHKTLGAMESPIGDYSAEHERLQQKSDSLARQVYSATLSPQEAIMIYQTIWRPAMAYSLPVGTLTMRKAHRIQSKMTRAVLQASGYNEHTPTEIVFGPPELGGVGLTHLFAEQGTTKVKLLIQELRSPGVIGTKLRIMLQWAQLLAGTSLPILQHPHGWLPQLEDEAYLNTLREFLAISSLALHIGGIRCTSPRRTDDHAIMDILLQSHYQSGFSDDDVLCINRVRIHLRVETLSDITNAKGTAILSHFWHSTHPKPLLSDQLWPHQPCPGPISIRVWQRFVATLCKYKTLTLLRPLGTWTQKPTAYDFDTWTHSTSELVAITDGALWTIHETYNNTRRGRILGRTICSMDRLDLTEWQPVDRQHHYQGFATVHCNTSLKQATDDTPSPSKRSWKTDITRYRTFYPSQEALAVILRDPTKRVTIVSDGGSDASGGTFGWNISCDNTIIAEGLGKAWGGPMSSYRAEAFGKLAWLTLLKASVEIGNENIRCTITSYCDNMGIIRATSLLEESVRPLCPDYDVIKEIHATQLFLLKNQVPLMSSLHIKGHQDSTKPSHALSWPATMNVHADVLATQARDHRYRQPRTWQFDHCDTFLIDHGSPISSQEVKSLQWNWRNSTLRDYYNRRLSISHDSIDLINWAGYASARRRLSTAERKFSTKFLISWLPTGRRLARQGDQTSTCHRCAAEETDDHIMQCSHLSRDSALLISQFNTELCRLKTDKDVKTALTLGLSYWLTKLSTEHNKDSSGTVPRSCSIAHAAQSTIGWRLLPRGLLAEEWSRIQEFNAPAMLAGRTVGDTWNANVSTWLIRRFRERWQHRNNEIQNPQDKPHHFISRQEIETREKVRHLYSCAQHVSYTDRSMIFSTSLEDHLLLPQASLFCWVQAYETTIKECVAQHKKRSKAGHRDIRTAFSIRPRPARPTPAAKHTQRTRKSKMIQQMLQLSTTQPRTHPQCDKANTTSSRQRVHTTPAARLKRQSILPWRNSAPPTRDSSQTSATIQETITPTSQSKQNEINVPPSTFQTD